MKNLIVPIAGKSNRFPGTRPKWLLNHPKTNRLMVTASIEGLNLDAFDAIHFGFLSEHLAEYEFLDGLKQDLNDIDVLSKCHFSTLDSTRSQSDTVNQIIKQQNIQGYVFVKDSDNYFKTVVHFDNNQVCSSTLEEHFRIVASNKSYLSVDVKNHVMGITEKEVVSNTFSVGGYGFKDADKFSQCYEKLRDKYETGRECYISHVIFQMILDGAIFVSRPVQGYLDWGTLDDWLEYKKQFQTVFCDIDGTLITNTGIHLRPKIGRGRPMKNNIAQIQALRAGVIVLTTSRPERYREETMLELSRHQIPYDHLIMGLPHGKRVVINDYAASNPYPACESINLPRDSDTLYLK